MKNLLKSAFYLSVFTLAGIIFQISCSNSESTTLLSSTPIGKIIFTKVITTGTSSQQQIWTSNYDGTDQTQIPVTLPPNVYLNFYTGTNTINSGANNIKLSPDGQKVFFVTIANPNQSNQFYSIYSCDLSGANLTEVIAVTGNQDAIELGGAY